MQLASTTKLLPVAKAQTPDELLEHRDYSFQFWKSIFILASEMGASDIHVEPFESTMIVRFRLNGILQKVEAFSEEKELRKDALNKLKTLCRMDLSAQDITQDGAFSLKLTHARYRVALCPSEFGESFVFRVINDRALPTLEKSNLSETTIATLKDVLSQEQGLILITGPTGSGKSTTLQAALMEIDRDSKKVITIEDPIERILPGILQTQIGKRLSWADSIKSAMRRDPDIILIGEIRDIASASLAIEAANTGHLVISTLHANNVTSTFDRLIGLGVEKELLAENALLISAQRLLKKICQQCRIKDENTTFWKQGHGCKNCPRTPGVIGRLPILEYTLRPKQKSILEFDRQLFQKNEIKVSLNDECQRLVREGLVDSSYLEHWRAI